MTNNDQWNARQYQGNPRTQQHTGANGQSRAYGVGNGVGYPNGQPQNPPQGRPQAGQPYSYPPQIAGYNQYGQPVYAQGQSYVRPVTSQPVQMKQKRGKKAIVAAVIVALLCIAAAVAIFLLTQDGSSSRGGTKGQLEGKTEAEIQAELNREVAEGMFNISIASVVEFADGTSEGELRIENVPGNNYLMKVNIARDDTNETIYTSDIIEPDYHIQRDTLDVDLPQGMYPCTATFTAFDPETEDEIGQAAAKITVQVKS